jgi:hypothetical protein
MKRQNRHMSSQWLHVARPQQQTSTLARLAQQLLHVMGQQDKVQSLSFE